MEETALTPRTVTELKQVTPEEISTIAENVMEADKVLRDSTDELEHLSSCLDSLSYSKNKYDEVSKEVKGKLRNIVTRI